MAIVIDLLLSFVHARMLLPVQHLKRIGPIRAVVWEVLLRDMQEKLSYTRTQRSQVAITRVQRLVPQSPGMRLPATLTPLADGGISMTRLHSATFAFISLSIVLGLASPCEAQFAQISFPDNGSVVSGTALIVASQLNTVADPALTSSITFQYSTDGVTWNNIDSDQGTVGNATNSQSPRDWQVLWDTTQVASGAYFIRAQFYLSTINVLYTTSPVSVTVNLPPNAIASGSIWSNDLAQLTGASSYDPDGRIVSWAWDFGDGTTGTGPAVSHVYAPGQYVAVLTVIDNLGAQAAAYLDVDTTALNVENSRGALPPTSH